MRYMIVPLFWGSAFPRPSNDPTWASSPYTPQQLMDGLVSIRDAGYFSRLAQYGAEHVEIQSPTTLNDPWPAGTSYYVAVFTLDDVVGFLTRHLPSFNIVFMDRPIIHLDLRPIFLVVLPNGSLLDVNLFGAHTVTYLGTHKVTYAWIYAGDKLEVATRYATHEIVEAIGADLNAPKELCDDCAKQFPVGLHMPGGVQAETYFDQQAGGCVAPGNLEGWSRPLKLPPGIGPQP